MASNHYISADRFQQPVESDHQDPPGGPVLLGESVAVRRLRSQIRRIAPYFRTALIRGETGSGKQLVARCLHAGSPGAYGPFVVAQAAALGEPFARGEAARVAGIRAIESLDSANGGTLYLEGLGDLSFAQQAGLCRFLRACERQGSTTSSVGAEQPASRVRIIAASDRDLRALAAIGQFRQDLYAHLSAVEILVPPLRQRLEDIPAITEWLLRRLAEQTQQGPKQLAEATILQLQKTPWPHNLRELERVVCQAAALAEGSTIEPSHLLTLVEPGFSSPAAVPAERSERLHDVIQQHVLDVLGRCSGNKLRTAEALGISRSTLYRMLGAKDLRGTY